MSVAVTNEDDELDAPTELVTIATEAVAIIGETVLRIESVEDGVLVIITLVDRVSSAERLLDA